MTVLLRAFYLSGHFCFLSFRMFPVGKTRCPVSSFTLGWPFFFMGWGIRTSCFGGTYLLRFCFFFFLIVSTSYYIESDLRVFRHQLFTQHVYEFTPITLSGAQLKKQPPFHWSLKKLSLLSLLRNVGVQCRNS